MALGPTKLQQLQHKTKDLKIIIDTLKAKAAHAELDHQEREHHLKEEIKHHHKVINNLQQAIQQLTQENTMLKTERDQLKSEVDILQDRANKLTAMTKKTPSTSDTPPSSNPFRKRTKSTRKKSGRKPGGQEKHPGWGLKPYPNPTHIINKRPPEKCSCGGHIHPNETYTPKQLVDVKVSVTVTEERVYIGRCSQCGKKHRPGFSEEYINPVQYGSSLMALVAMLNTYANVPIGKTVDFLSGLTNGEIRISHGTVVNINTRLASLLEDTVALISERILASDVLGADETGLRIGGHLEWMQVMSTESYTLFGRNEKRGGLCIEGTEILVAFTGILIHDHFMKYYQYKHMSHAECNAHILRYLESIIEILQHPWAKDMADFLREVNTLKKQYIENDCYAFEPEKREQFKQRYLAILEQGQLEYADAIQGKHNISYYNDERCLLARLKEFADQHLLFLENFAVPFDNNRSEQDVHFMKKKQKTAGLFRSATGADNYARIASFLATLRKQHMDIHANLKSIFDGEQIEFIDVQSSA
jgi:transposase